MNIAKLVGKKIRYYRKQADISQERLAELAKLHRTYIGAVERGEKNITIVNLEKIAEALKIETYLLLKTDDSE